MVASACSDNEIEKSPISVSSGTVYRIEDFNSEYISSRNIDIWLPDGYQAEENYPVLYMHDGQMLFDSSITWNGQEWGVDEVMNRLISEDSIDAAIVVGIWNIPNRRHTDYFPEKPFMTLPKDYRDSLLKEVKKEQSRPLFTSGIQSDIYLKFIVNELKPFIDEHFSTKGNRNNTFIAGSSLGGLISMYAICEYPEVFGGAACLSTHWPGTYDADNNPIPKKIVDYLETHLPDPESHKIYFDYGTRTLDSLYEPYQKQVDSVMVRKGYDEQSWKTLKFEGHDHSENSWHKRLHIPLQFLFGKIE
jgi:predicted alpha/beta superfamily hydrolase